MRLPIEDALPELLSALDQFGRAVLEAPPGAGKTTRVPIAMMEHGAVAGRIVMLEPRRIAARSAADRMAETLGEKTGGRVGYRIRGSSAISAETRIEVVTEGILTRMLQDSPDLPGIGAVIFDEFHERSLVADLGLALAWEARAALRPDLKLVVMSATLDAGPVAALLDEAPRVQSTGRAYPVDTRWRAQPSPRHAPLDLQIAELVGQALAETTEGILVFLPGEAEIRRLAGRLARNLPTDVVLQPLYGALPLKEQRAAIRPAQPGRRKLVLATAIAETSLTISDIGVVIDSGLARRARHDPNSGMSRLVTEMVSRAEADQRRGRAGRLAQGVCFRNWTKGAEGALPLFPPPEIETTDLAPLALELAQWSGRAVTGDLRFLTAPPAGALRAACDLLQGLDALDPTGQITDHGRQIARLPLHPRLAHMLARSGPAAAPLAALLSDRDPIRHAGADLGPRLRAVVGSDDQAADPAILARLRAEAKRLQRFAKGADRPPEAAAALAYPDRIALRRPGDAPRYLLSGGKGAMLDPADGLAGQRLLVVTDLDGDRTEARIRGALPIAEGTLRDLFRDQIGWIETCSWSRRTRRVEARRQERLGALNLRDEIWRDPPDAAVIAAVIDGIRDLGLAALGWSAAAKRLRARIAFSGLVEMDDTALLAALEDWAAPYLSGLRSAADLAKFDPHDALRAMLGWEGARQLDHIAPAQFETPLGRNVPVSYGPEGPEISVRLQEVYGLTQHPCLGPNSMPLRMTLLSPAGRPVQVTTDLPGFWAGSYADVRKDMRARYPKHPWPDDPRQADPTLRPKPRR